jgi:hypothetical protein
MVLMLVLVGGLWLGPAPGEAGGHARWMKGTWMTIIPWEQSPTGFLPEIGSFDLSGTVVYQSGFPPVTLPLDGLGPVTFAPKVGLGTWKCRRGAFAGTQWRFLYDLETGMPIGYSKLVSEWELLDRKTARGDYRVEILRLDMEPHTVGGQPVVFEGSYEMFKLPVEPLP